MKRALSVAILLLPTLALAHPGADGGAHHGSAFMEGLIHPFTGFDHLAAMLAVGAWSALAFKHSARRMWAVVIAFAALLLAGGMAGMADASLPLVEPMIAASLLVLGVMVATQIKLPVAVGAAVVGTFAIFHGFTHGSELPATQAFATLAGMVLGTMSIHAIGILAGRLVLQRNEWLPRVAGAAVALLGIGLLTGAL
ncbi:MAG: urease accessory protein UreJ [Rhodocyclales bacterium]|nr:urease accessory protein UreJ [Rhodocyclales bacterium]